MSVGGIYGFVLLQCRFGSDYASWTLTVCLLVSPCRSEISKKSLRPVLSTTRSDFHSCPSSSHGDVKGTDILPVKWRRSSFRPLHTAEFEWKRAQISWKSWKAMFDSVPAVFSAALRVLPAAGAQRLHAVPAPQQRALGPVQQTTPILRERQRSDLRRGRDGRRARWAAGPVNECEPGCMSWAYLNGTDDGQQQREQDDPFLKSPHGVSRPGRALHGEPETFILGSSIKALNRAGRSQHAGSSLICFPVCAINDCIWSLMNSTDSLQFYLHGWGQRLSACSQSTL